MGMAEECSWYDTVVGRFRRKVTLRVVSSSVWIKDDLDEVYSRMGSAHAGTRTVQKVWRTPNNNPMLETSPFA